MTISTSTGRIQYNGNSSTTAFATNYKLLDSSHVRVILTDASSVDTVQTETTEYTVSGIGNSTATVTMVTAPATGETLTLKLNPPFTQTSDLVNGQSFDAEIIEQALDLSTQVDQGTDEKITRCLRAAESVSTSFDGEMGALTALYIPRINAAKTGFELVSATALALAGAFTAADGNFLVGDGTDFVEESGATVRASLGLDSMATQASTSVAITGGTIAGVTSLGVAGSITVTGTVDGVDVAALKTDVDGFPDALKNLTSGEIGELENIGSTTVSSTQWGYLGATDQSLATTDNVSFTNGDFTGTEALKVPAGTTAQRPGTPVDGDLRVNTTTATLEVFRDTAWRGLESGGGGTMSNVVEDTTPQLGGQLDVNGNAIGDGTNELITFTENASAVNQVNISNAATGSGATISVAGGDTNIDLVLSPKAAGDLVLDGLKWPQTDGTANQLLETDGSGQLSFVTVSAGSGTWSELATATASSSASVEFTGFSTSYRQYLVIFSDVKPATNATDLLFTVSTDSGSSYVSSGYAYFQTGRYAGTTTEYLANSTSFAQIPLNITSTNNLKLGSANNETCSGKINFSHEDSDFVMRSSLFAAGPTAGRAANTETVGTAGAAVNGVNGIKFALSSGNIASGTFTLYGLV